MSNDELDEFFLGGGDELMNSEECPACGVSIYLDRPIDWVDEEKGGIMRRVLCLVVLCLFIAGCACHVPPGQIKKETTPGHIMQDTGYNPASGKVKTK